MVEKSIDQELVKSSSPVSFHGIQKFVEKINHPIELTWEFGATFFISLGIILSRFIGLGVRVTSHDESLHTYYSWLLSTGSGYIHTPMMHGPFLFESTALMNFIFGANDFVSRLVPAILGTFIAIAIPQLLKPWIGRIGALVGSVLFMVSPYMLYYSRYIRHDTIVIAWMLLAVVAILGYLFNRKEQYLVLFVTMLALMFSTMEITFIYLAIFATFIFVRMMTLYGLHWKAIKSSAEFDLLILMITLGAFFSSTIALTILNPIFVKAYGSPFVDIAVLGSQGTEWISGQSGVRLFGLLGVFTLISFGIGLSWGRLRWLKLAGLFIAICITLFSTVFSNPAGIASGFIGSLGYWLSQQAVARGSQPWYYFLIVFPIYEYLPLIGGICAVIFFMIKRRFVSDLARLFVPFLLWWALGIFFALSLAGEKMPWLSTHITVPFILLTAWWIGQLLDGDWRKQATFKTIRQLFFGVGLASLGLMFFLTVRTSIFVNYINYDYATEFIDYARGAPGVKWVMDDIEAIADHTGAGKDLKIAFDDEVSWPMSWYLRDYPNRSFFGAQLTREALNAPVIISGSKNWNKIELLVGPDYHRFEVIRMWWAIEDYKDLNWGRIRSALINPDMRKALWDILWERDYTRYASLTGSVIKPPTDWPLVDKMRIYVRKDIALQMLSLSLGSSILADVPQIVDEYAGIQREITPDLIISTGELTTPRNMTIGKDGGIFVVDTGNSRMVKFNPKGEFITSWGSQTLVGQTSPEPGTFNEPWGITTDSEGNILVADTWNHRIQKFDPEGKFLLQWGVPGGIDEGLDRMWGPRGLVASPDGTVYVTDTGNKRVIAFSPKGKALFAFESTGDALLDEPVGITIGTNGNVYVADTWNKRVAIFSANGSYLSSFSIRGWKSESMENKPYLVVDQVGQILVTDPENFRVLVFSADGDPLFVFGNYGVEENSFGMPNGITIDSAGSVWIADAGNNRLEQFSNIQP